MSLRVAWISHCPVKGLAVRQLDECELTEAGITGDREFFLVDENDRLVNAKGLGVLQQIVPRYDREAGSLTLDFPDGTTITNEIGFDGSLGANFWGDTVEVRVVQGPWSEAISDLAGRDLRLVGGSGPSPDRRRGGAATLLGTGSLEALARVLGEDEIDERHRDALAPGDQVLIYLGAPEREFIGRAELASAADSSEVRLAQVEEWNPPVPMSAVLARIDSPAAKADFEAGVVLITAKEYETALAVAAERETPAV